MIMEAGTKHEPNFAKSRYRNRIIESATSTRMNTVTHLLANAVNSCGGRCLTDRKERIAENYTRFEKIRSEFESNWSKGKVSVLDHVDFDQLIKECVDDVDRSAILGVESKYRTQRVVESLGHALTSDWLSHLLVDVVRYGIIERAELQPRVHLSMVDRNIRLAPGSKNSLVKFRSEADVVEDNLGEEEVVSMYQPAPPILVTLPEPKKKSFAMSYTREALTVAPNDILRQEIDRYGTAMDLHIEKLLVDLLWGLYDHATPGANPTPYIESGVTIHPYQSVGGAGPWENQIFDNDLDGTSVPFSAIEQIIEDRRDPYSGEPITYGENSRLICTTKEQVRQAVQGLGVIQVGQDLGGPANKRQAVEIPAGQFDISSADIVHSAYAKDRITEWYQTPAGGGKTATDAKTAAEQTWLHIDPSRAACFATEWEREKITREGTETKEYFDQDILYSAKWSEKSTVGWKDPQFAIRNIKS